MGQRDLGWLIGVLATRGSFTGDGKQPVIQVRMHVRSRKTLDRAARIAVGTVYGPYNHAGRHYVMLLIRGQALRRLVDLIWENLDLLDDYAASRFEHMCCMYSLATGSPEPLVGLLPGQAV